MLNNNISETTPVADIIELGKAFEEPRKTESFEEAKTLMRELKDMEIIYDSALKEILTKLNILNNEFISMHSRNPIHTMKSRVKDPKSTVEKLMRKGNELTIKEARKVINDIAGIRIICPYIKDIYVIKQLVENQDDLEIIKIVDYIKNPKPNGYRSLHMILRVPVFFSDHKERVKVEVQIRTIAMDFWASLEHQLRYKTDQSEPIPEDISNELKACADIIASTDIRMQDIHNRVFQL